MKRHSKLFEEVIVKSWWTILFFLVCYFAYDRGLHYRTLEKEKLTKKLEMLSQERRRALIHHDYLRLQLESQHDNAWIELVLMRGLGLVPEGQQKVIFLKS